MSWLVRRRQVWLPTLWGALLLIVVIAAALAVVARGAYGWLALSEPARGVDGRGARTLVVEGWMEAPQLVQAVAVFRRGHYDRVLTTGGPIEPWGERGTWPDYASRAAAYLHANGLADVTIVAVPAPPTQLDRTYHSALTVREWARHEHVALDSIDLFSAGAHLRRTRMVYRMALGDGVEVGVIAAVPQDFDVQRWWTSSAGTKSIVGEGLSLAWTVCCFWPPRPDAAPAATK